MDEHHKRLDIELAVEIVSAYVSNNKVSASELPDLLASIAHSLDHLFSKNAEVESPEPLKPAVPIKKSITPDFIISLEDGKKFKSLKRALSARYGMTPDQYRHKWGLPLDYPMVAPNYSAARSDLAKKLGLGRKPSIEPAPSPTAKGGTRRRKKVI